MSAVIADTHTVLWALLTPESLSQPALAALQQAQISGAPIYVSAISLVEVAYLVEKGRLAEAAYARLNGELSMPDSGFVVAPLDLAVAQLLPSIPRIVVPDMPDRIIAATALRLGVPLVTRDPNIRAAQVETIW